MLNPTMGRREALSGMYMLWLCVLWAMRLLVHTAQALSKRLLSARMCF
jgi:steroid 5-alpha reductase family enzyme